MVDHIYSEVTGRGQLMERSTIIQCGDLTLDAILLRGARSPSVIVAPGRYAGSSNMEGPLANELAYAASYAGHGSLRFAWRGHSGSEGEKVPPGAPITPLIADLAAVLETVVETFDSSKVLLAAIRDGCDPAVEFAHAEPRVTALLLLEPSPGLNFDGLNRPIDCFFAGEVGIPGCYTDLPPDQRCWRNWTIKDADPFWRRGLGELGQRLAQLLGGGRHRPGAGRSRLTGPASP